MQNQPIGYQYLVEKYNLPARPLERIARVDTTLKGREVRTLGHHEALIFEMAYYPKDTLAGHVQFALKYEGVNLEVLVLLFGRTGGHEVESWLREKPESAYARRAGFLYEWLTGGKLEARAPAKTRYVPVVDTGMQFALVGGRRVEKFKVVDNLPGTPVFCPMVRRTPFLIGMMDANLGERIKVTLDRYDPDLLRRAATFLYLKETQSSFEVERENPSADRAQRFADLLRQADTRQPLTERRLIELQQAVVDSRFRESGWRSRQNWLGKDRGYRKQVDFVPPRPEDVPDLISGLLAMTKRATESVGGAPPEPSMEPVVFAASVSFGFVFIHPFMDGNGRIHRYLIHDLLEKTGFTPPGIVLPVSAVILANLKEYVEVLEAFSKPVQNRTRFEPAAPERPAIGNDTVYFRYFDCTPQAEFLYKALQKTIVEDLQKEIDFLIGFDRARSALDRVLDWPGHDLDLFIRCLHQNRGRLSNAKRASHFDWMTDAEVALAEGIAAESFGWTD